MAKTEIEEKFDYLVSKVIWSHFKPLGYKKSGNNFRFYDDTNEWGKIVNFQKSMYYNKEHIHFTINIGLFLNDTYLNFGKPPGNKFTEPSCVIRNRIGDLMNTKDTWYDLTPETDIENFSENIETIFKKYILSYLNKYKSKQDIFFALTQKIRYSVNELECLFYNGYKKQALDALEKELKGAKNEHYIQNLLKTKNEFLNNQ